MIKVIKMRNKTLTILVGGLLCLFANNGYTRDAAQLVDELTFEDLLTMDVQVKTAAKNNEKLLETPAAVFVITAEDIERFGVTTIPDALRMAPGVHVGRLSTTEWAVGIRGRNGRYSRFIQVLLDGRSIYDPIFSGVNWDEYALNVEDIARIEVVRGPGGVLWGANAVNGVINIVRKSASQQQGLAVKVGAGSEQHYSASLHYGVALGAQSFLSAFAKSQSIDGFSGVSGFIEDDWQSLLTGISFEHISQDDHLFLQARYVGSDDSYTGAIFDLSIPQKSNQNIQQDNRSYDIQLKWKHDFSDTAWLDSRLALSESERKSSAFHLNSENTELDLEYTQLFGSRHQLSTGLNAQRVDSHIHSQPATGIMIRPPDNVLSKSSLFVQDQIQLRDDLHLVAGFRYDYYSDSDNSSQYSLRGIWRPDDRRRLWLALSKAITTPNRITVDESAILISAANLDSPFIPPANRQVIIATEHSGEPLANTKLLAYELGGRYLVTDSLSLDASLYHYRYSNLLSNMASNTGAGFSLTADRSTHQSGAEWVLNWKLDSSWTLQYTGSYLFDDTDTQLEAESFFDPQLVALVPELQTIVADLKQLNISDNAPHSLHSLRLAGTISDKFDLGVWWRYVDDIETTPIDAYTAVDINFNIRAANNLTVAIVAQNLFADGHFEFGRTILGSELFKIPAIYAVHFEWQY